jgi:heat shock protein HslJ
LSTRQRIALVAVIVVIAAMAAAAKAASWYSASAHRLDLFGTSWSVESIDGRPAVPSGKATISFPSVSPNPSSTMIETGCRVIRAEWDMDSDGDAIGFNVPADNGESLTGCPPELTRQDRALVTALAGTESWTVDNQDAIVLHGTNEIRLRRMPTPASTQIANVTRQMAGGRSCPGWRQGG